MKLTQKTILKISVTIIINNLLADYEFDNGLYQKTNSEEGDKIALKAAECLVDLFAVVWNTVGQTTKAPNGSRKYKVT